MRKLSAGLAVFGALVALAGFAVAQEKSSSPDTAYIAEAMSAAPRAVAKNATIVRMDESGKMTTLRQGKNGFTCMVVNKEKMCADANSMAFFDAWMKKAAPPDKIGLTYM